MGNSQPGSVCKLKKNLPPSSKENFIQIKTECGVKSITFYIVWNMQSSVLKHARCSAVWMTDVQNTVRFYVWLIFKVPSSIFRTRQHQLLFQKNPVSEWLWWTAGLLCALWIFHVWDLFLVSAGFDRTSYEKIFTAVSVQWLYTDIHTLQGIYHISTYHICNITLVHVEDDVMVLYVYNLWC